MNTLRQLEQAVLSSSTDCLVGWVSCFADIGIDRDLVVRGDADSVSRLTVPLMKDGEGFRGEFDLAVSF